MKDIKTMISVMLAYADGKKIEYKENGKDNWQPCDIPYWNWLHGTYRIKPEPEYRPFANTGEFFAEAQKHGWWVRLLNTDIRFFVNAYDNTAMRTGGDWMPYKDVLKAMCWADDGTPCGVLEEE